MTHIPLNISHDGEVDFVRIDSNGLHFPDKNQQDDSKTSDFLSKNEQEILNSDEYSAKISKIK